MGLCLPHPPTLRPPSDRTENNVWCTELGLRLSPRSSPSLGQKKMGGGVQSLRYAYPLPLLPTPPPLFALPRTEKSSWGTEFGLRLLPLPPSALRIPPLFALPLTENILDRKQVLGYRVGLRLPLPPVFTFPGAVPAPPFGNVWIRQCHSDACSSRAGQPSVLANCVYIGFACSQTKMNFCVFLQILH
jgi:hypothetical protein